MAGRVVTAGRGTKGGLSRARLLDAARRAFARDGFHETKVGDIVAAAGLTQAAFYLYFPSKDAIFAELVAGFRARLAALTGAMRPVAGMTADDVPAQIHANLREMLRFLAADPDLSRLALFTAPDAESFRRELAEAVAAHLRAKQRAGLVRAGLAADVLAEAQVGMVERLAVRFLFTGARTADDLAAEVAAFVLGGVLPATAAGTGAEEGER